MNRGFVALTITTTIAGILLALVAAASIERANFFDHAMKKVHREMNYYYAYDCIDQAILSLAHDYFHTIREPRVIPEFHCTILSIRKDGELHHVLARGDYRKAYVYRSATVKVGTHNLEVIVVN